jgi:hypothetical protein
MFYFGVEHPILSKYDVNYKIIVLKKKNNLLKIVPSEFWLNLKGRKTNKDG